MKLILFVLLSLLCPTLLLLLLREKQKIRKLTRSVDDFLSQGTPTPISTRDDAPGHLQMEICRMQEQIRQEQNRTRQEALSNQQFLSDISHQLKTPLAGLRLYCEMEHASAPGPHTEKELELIEKMEKLIANVLKLEKLKGDTYEMQFTDCDLTRIACQLRGELLPLFPEKTIVVQGQARLRADPEWFREALGNVMKNACEHTNGTVQVTLEPGERSVSITVEDNGGGVPPDELPNLFRRFSVTSNAAPGSAGIGLAITKAIVEKHHGIITARNGKEGLKITMCLPVVEGNLTI